MFSSRPPRRSLALLTLVALAACSGADRTSPLVAGDRPSAGKTATTTSSISSVSPDSSAQSTTLDVKVNGSGLVDGMVVQWGLSGIPDSTQIRTNRTTFVSSKQLIANITISGSASTGAWDVMLFSGGKTGVGSEMSTLKGAFKVTDPTATFLYPLNDAGLAVRSDHAYSNGTMSAYANGTCGVTTTMNYSTSGSGDVVLNTNYTKGGRCNRYFTFVYPDGVTETLPSVNNLREIENSTYAIPVGQTVLRQLHMGSNIWSNVSSRCGGHVWGYGVANNVGAGSDSVLVTRVDASTWHVQTQPAPHNLAWCKNTGQLFAMPVDFTVMASRALP